MKSAKDESSTYEVAGAKKILTQGEVVGAVDANAGEEIQPYVLNEDEQYMNDSQVAHFSLILHNMKQQLMEEVDTTVSSMRDADKHLSDFTDRASSEEEMLFMLRARTREGKLLGKIHGALNRISNKHYGYCDICGDEIGLRRLEARPTATLCIDCKINDEIREKQTRAD